MILYQVVKDPYYDTAYDGWCMPVRIGNDTGEDIFEDEFIFPSEEMAWTVKHASDMSHKFLTDVDVSNILKEKGFS